MPASDDAREQNNDLILVEDDPFDPADQLVQEGEPWRILIVDDDVDVHVVTKFALSTSSFQGRRLSFLHAYSGKEALEILGRTPDIALVLLDVIMETPDAGLRVAQNIRAELHNELVRIVLRTGQPGQALEHSIIVDYDINDFWCKADLTTRKLFTTVIASLRAYTTLKAATLARDAQAAQLAQARNLQAAVDRHALVVTLGPDGRVIDANERFCAVACKPRTEVLGASLPSLLRSPAPERLHAEILAALSRDGGWAGDIRDLDTAAATLDLRCAVLAFRRDDGDIDQYVAVATPRDPQL
jgi:CheY-like chemotaxis protein